VAGHDDPLDDLKAWLADNWDPTLTVREWWERLGTSGWGAPAWPVEFYGKGLGREETNRVARAIAEFGALGAPQGLGMLLAGPTILAHGSDEQKRRYLGDIVTGRKAWCQLFSEPVAGSDLAGLQTRAERDGDEWIVNGQKVWTSTGQYADLGMLIVRTNPDAPKHKGITYFAIEMDQPGIDIRPLREMTGRSLFNEVFLTDARVPDSELIGGLDNGWAVANTTLAAERSGLGSGGHGVPTLALPGVKAGSLDKPAGEFVVAPEKRIGASSGGSFGSAERLLIGAAQRNGKITDPTIRQDLMRLHTLTQIGRFTSMRLAAAKAQGRAAGPEASTSKLAMSQIIRLVRDLGPRVLGAEATLHAYGYPERVKLLATGVDPVLPAVTEMTLFAPAPTIYGGSDEIQRNIIGERALGLPKEPGDDRTTAFRDLPKNASR
jgi:alkylation response protein AidB-like acyl-CoA dehydrogenase